MKPSPKMFDSFLRIAAALMLLISAGCYEGWHRPNVPAGGGESKGGGSGDKPYSLILLDVIEPSADAMAEPSCANIPSSLLEVRRWEVKERKKSVQAALSAIADKIVVQETSVKPGDCGDMALIWSLAHRGELPTLPSNPTSNDKPAAHVRLALWFNDSTPALPQTSVIADEWSASEQLHEAGYPNVVSTTDFAVTGDAWRYFFVWMSNADSKYQSLVIPQPRLDDAGLREVAASIKTSAEGFATYLSDRSGQ